MASSSMSLSHPALLDQPVTPGQLMLTAPMYRTDTSHGNPWGAWGQTPDLRLVDYLK